MQKYVIQMEGCIVLHIDTAEFRVITCGRCVKATLFIADCLHEIASSFKLHFVVLRGDQKLAADFGKGKCILPVHL